MKELENVKILYSSDYWDGPLNGLCEYENKYYWFGVNTDEEYDEKEDKWSPRIFQMYDIEPWQLTYELYWHSIFVTNVYKNTKCKYNFDEQLKNDRFKIKENFYKKREKEYKKIDYYNNNKMNYRR